jgi:biotin-[acetyl-CoA-carboxylase] ligase BirA-like protein
MLELNIPTPFNNAPIFYKPETESTMIDARNLASQGFPTGTLIVTSYQVAGRGRFPDRKWESPPGESLLCTLILRTADVPDPPAPLSLKTALAIATLLEEEFQLQPAIKWPNDVLLKERKVAGILAERKDQAILIGMGINCLQKSFPKELRNTATSIRKVSGKKFEVQDLISPLLTHLHRWLFAASSVVSTAMSAAEFSGFSLTPSWKTELENRAGKPTLPKERVRLVSARDSRPGRTFRGNDPGNHGGGSFGDKTRRIRRNTAVCRWRNPLSHKKIKILLGDLEKDLYLFLQIKNQPYITSHTVKVRE